MTTLQLTHEQDIYIHSGNPIDYRNMVISLRVGMEKSREELIEKLVEMV